MVLIVPAPHLQAHPPAHQVAPPPPPPLPPPPVAPIPAEPVELDYAGTAVPKKAESLVVGAARPIPVIARPSQNIEQLDKSWRGRIWWMLVLLMIPLGAVTLRSRMTLQERIDRTMARIEADAAKAATQPTTLPSFGSADEGYPGLDDALTRFVAAYRADALRGSA